MRRRDAKLGTIVVLAGLVAACVALAGASGSAAAVEEPHDAAALVRVSGAVVAVSPDLKVRSDWQWAPLLGEATDVLTVTLAPGAHPEPSGARPIEGDVVELVGRRDGATFVADELTVVDPD